VIGGIIGLFFSLPHHPTFLGTLFELLGGKEFKSPPRPERSGGRAAARVIGKFSICVIMIACSPRT
jgi:hypothetical protein